MQDPLITTGTASQFQLYRELAKVCSRRPVEDVVGAAINLMTNALRQTYRSREQALAYFEAAYGRNKQVLLDHYDPVTGRLRTVIPFDQVIHAAHVIDQDKF